MTKLDELIQELCPDGVKYKALGEICKLVTGATPSKTNAAYWENGTIPWMSSGEVNLKRVAATEKKITQLGYEKNSTTIVPKHSVVIALAGQGKTRGKAAITEIELCTNQSLCSMICNENLDYKFLYYILDGKYEELRAISNGDGTRGGLSLKILAPYKIPVPPLPVQCEIVRILDNFTELTAKLTAKLTAELTARKKQYAYYRDKLLTMGTEQVAVCNLGDIADIYTGSKPNEILDTISDYEYINAGTGNSGYTEQPNCEGDTVTTPSRGQGGIGYVGYQSKPFYLGPLCYAIRSKTQEFIINKYIYHWLVSHSSDILVLKNEGGTPALNKTDLAKIRIKVPPLSVQNRLVEVLDNFDAICTDLSSGLPAEIEARQKQYEYYRDKLLSFEEKI